MFSRPHSCFQGCAGLHKAAAICWEHTAEDVVKFLVSKGADVNAEDAKVRIEIHMVEYGHWQTCSARFSCI